MNMRVLLQRVNGQVDSVQVLMDALKGVTVIEYDNALFLYQPGHAALTDLVFVQTAPALVLETPPDAGRKFFGQGN